MPDPTRPLALGAVAMVVCCVGHTLLLTAGVGGLGAFIGAGTGNRLLFIGAAALSVAATTVAVLRLLRHRR